MPMMTKEIYKHNNVQFEMTQSQADFARYYAATGKASESRLRAGYKDSDKPNHNESMAYQLLRTEGVLKGVEYFRHELSKKIDISENRILAEMATMAFSNVGDLFNKHGEMINIKSLSIPTQRAIKGVTVKSHWEGKGEDAQEVTIVKVDMHPKLQALERLAEIKGMKTVDSQATRPIEVNININGQETPAIEKRELGL